MSQHLALMTPSRCSGEWLAYALSTSDARLQLDAAGYGGTKTQLGLEDVANVTVPYVAVEEEEGVLAELRDRLGRIEVSKQALATQRLLLKERRQALITAAVSGQLDIPEAA